MMDIILRTIHKLHKQFFAADQKGSGTNYLNLGKL